MIAAYLIVAVLAGTASFVTSLILGQPFWVAVLAYSVGGLLGFFGAVALRLLAGVHERDGEEDHARSERPDILVVDDDPLVLDLVCAALEGSGTVQVTTAASAREAVELIDTPGRRFDGFLLDILMREMDGIELCRHLRRDTRYSLAPVVMLTRKADMTHIDRAFAAGATDYIVKPFTDALLRDQVVAMLRMRNAEGQDQIEVDFAEAFEIANVPGFLKADAAQNYILRAAATEGGRQGAVHIFRLENAEALFRSVGQAAFQARILLIGQLLSAVIRRTDAFLTYSGEGVFLCIIRGSVGLDGEKVAFDVSNRLQQRIVTGQAGIRMNILHIRPDVREVATLTDA